LKSHKRCEPDLSIPASTYEIEREYGSWSTNKKTDTSADKKDKMAAYLNSRGLPLVKRSYRIGSKKKAKTLTTASPKQEPQAQVSADADNVKIDCGFIEIPLTLKVPIVIGKASIK
jgi:hypothetical protein